MLVRPGGLLGAPLALPGFLSRKSHPAAVIAAERTRHA
jgi:hypothetical protein